MSKHYDSSANWLGQMGYQVVDAWGVDHTARLGGALEEGYAWEKNRVVGEGLAYMLNAALRGEGVMSTFYIAPFAANVTPAANMTAATFPTTMTEFTNYAEPNRVAWVTDGPATSTNVFLTNAAAPALFTIAGGPQNVIWGAALLSAQAKSSTSGFLFAAQKRATALAVESEFEVRIRYRILGQSS